MSGLDDQKKAVETFDQLCMLLENDLGIEIPSYIRNILLHSGFNNRLTIQSLSENDVNDLEIFGQSEMYPQVYARQTKLWSDRYGNHTFYKETFKILPGHRRLLLCITDYVKQIYHPPKPVSKCESQPVHKKSDAA